MVARGSASNPEDARNALLGGALPEVQLNPLDWDQRHNVNAQVVSGAELGAGTNGLTYDGPCLIGKDKTTDMTYKNNQQIDTSTSTSREPDTGVESVTLVIQLRVYNIFDIRNQINIYNDTGLAGVTIDQTIAAQTNPARINTLDQFYHTPTQYSEPRRIEFGMNLEF